MSKLDLEPDDFKLVFDGSRFRSVFDGAFFSGFSFFSDNFEPLFSTFPICFLLSARVTCFSDGSAIFFSAGFFWEDASIIFLDEDFLVRVTFGLALELVGFFKILVDRFGDGDNAGFAAVFIGEADLDRRL